MFNRNSGESQRRVGHLKIERERVIIIREGTCEYGYRAAVYCVTLEDVYPKDEEKRLCAFT